MSASINNFEIPNFDLQKHHQRVRVPEDFDLRDMARKFHIFPLKVIQRDGVKNLLLAMRNPRDQQVIYDVQFRAGMNVIPVQADDIDIQWLIQKHYYGRQLTPTPSLRPHEVTHDLFEQLSMTTNAQKRPDWINESLSLYEDKQSSSTKLK